MNIALIIYFSSLIASIAYVGKGILSIRARGRLLAVGASLLALAMAWTCIAFFLIEDAREHSDGRPRKLNRFMQAYKLVSDRPTNWMYSQQLLFWVCTMTIFFYVEGIRHKFQNYILAFTSLGFFGAISAAVPLFFIFLVDREQQLPLDRLRNIPRAPTLWIWHCLPVSVALGVVSIAITPFVTSNNALFIFAVVILHVLLLIPSIQLLFVPRPAQDFDPRESMLPYLYSAMSGISALAHVQGVLGSIAEHSGAPADQGLVSYILQRIADNYCQLSITGDLILTSACCFAYIWASHRYGLRVLSQTQTLVLALLTPVLSISVVFPFWLAIRERAIVKHSLLHSQQIARDAPVRRLSLSELLDS